MLSTFPVNGLGYTFKPAMLFWFRLLVAAGVTSSHAVLTLISSISILPVPVVVVPPCLIASPIIVSAALCVPVLLVTSAANSA
jgi:hypothetical protein